MLYTEVVMKCVVIQYRRDYLFSSVVRSAVIYS